MAPVPLLFLHNHLVTKATQMKGKCNTQTNARFPSNIKMAEWKWECMFMRVGCTSKDEPQLLFSRETGKSQHTMESDIVAENQELGIKCLLHFKDRPQLKLSTCV